ncbi:MAG TPA: hypothetical protein VNV87_14020 [Acidimicrobiales bacterium]|nr:hypothetical protein [Acidimicrobiales bacterium]
MLLSLKDNQASVLLGAARIVATARGTASLSNEGAGAIVSLAQLVLGADSPDLGSLSPCPPEDLASALNDADQAATAAELLAIIARCR